MTKDEYKHVCASMKAQIKANAAEARALREKARKADGTPHCSKCGGECRLGNLSRSWDENDHWLYWQDSVKHTLKLKAKAVGWDINQPTRELLLAYGLLRGREYLQIEKKCHQEPNWYTVRDIYNRHLPEEVADITLKDVLAWKEPSEEAEKLTA